MTSDVRTLEWTGDGLLLLDQTVLPWRVEYVVARDVGTLVDAIRRLVVRGAPALGVAGAFGVAIAVLEAAREGWDDAARDAAIARIREARPTAVNLAAGVDRVLPFAGKGADAVAAEAQALLDEDVRGNRAIGAFGAGWILDRAGDRPLRGLADVAVIGADRIAANGDTANKIGSVGVALACHAAGIPLVVAAPWSTVDLALPDGAGVPIEERPADEVLTWGGARTAPEGVGAFNPAFDVTPARLVTALVTETGVLEVSAGATPGGVRG